MLNLDGWDTVTLSDVNLVNAAMVRRQNELITTFDFREGHIHIKGRFGPWQIAPGGGGRSLLVHIPIQTGDMKINAGQHIGTDISGVTLAVKLKLMLLPPEGGADRSELRFDLTADAEAGPDDPVLPVDVLDPMGKLSDFDRQILVLATAACLSAHADDVTFVFASVKTRGTSDARQLTTPFHDWGHVVTADARQYLALYGALTKPKQRPDTIDPGLIATRGSAYLAFSHRLFAERFLLPAVEQSFRRRVFRTKGATVVNTSIIPLPPERKSGVKVHPFIDRMTLQISGKALVCHVQARATLGSLTFHCELTMTMPFKFDAKSGELRFLPDNSPKLKYTVSLPAPFDAIIGWLVRLFVHFFDAPIRSMITGIASSIQHVASPKVSSANWSGIRDFKTGAARVDGAIWLADTRPAETEAPKPVQLAWEIL